MNARTVTTLPSISPFRPALFLISCDPVAEKSPSEEADVEEEHRKTLRHVGARGKPCFPLVAHHCRGLVETPLSPQCVVFQKLRLDLRLTLLL